MDTPKVLRLSLALDENLRVATLAVLLEIAAGGTYGLTSRQLQQRLGLSQPAISRALLRLSHGSTGSKSVGRPLGLIILIPDPGEPRRLLARLSVSGVKLMEALNGVNQEGHLVVGGCQDEGARRDIAAASRISGTRRETGTGTRGRGKAADKSGAKL